MLLQKPCSHAKNKKNPTQWGSDCFPDCSSWLCEIQHGSEQVAETGSAQNVLAVTSKGFNLL